MKGEKPPLNLFMRMILSHLALCFKHLFSPIVLENPVKSTEIHFFSPKKCIRFP